MPQSLPDLRRHLQELLTEDLAAALTALKELLPEASEKHAQVLGLQARLKDTNKERIRNTLTPDDYQRRIDTIRADYLDLLTALEPPDFELPVAAPRSGGKPTLREGSVLYRVPQLMPISKPSICTVRVALDEDAILEDIVIDDAVRLRPHVEVSDMMRAELLDPEGEVFSIRPLSEAEQLVREQGYTQWLFSVTPRVEGEHQLLVKVSMMEYNPNLGRYVPREVSVLETVTIVTEVPALAGSDKTPLKATGEHFALVPGMEALNTRGVGTLAPGAPQVPASMVVPPAQTTQPAPARKRLGGSGRAAVLFLIFLLAGSATTWAFTPDPVRDWWWASLRDSTEAYADYIADYGNNSDPATRRRVEKAYFKKAMKTEALADLRKYLDHYADGDPILREQVLKKIEMLEKRAPENSRQQPESTGRQAPQTTRVPEQLTSGNQSEMQTKPEEQPKNQPADTPSPTKYTPPVRSGLAMVPVQGGTFIMGCQDGRDEDCSIDEKPAHTVTLSAFQIGKYEVTQADWRAVMGDNPSYFKNCDDCPVEQVSWDEIQEFLKKLNSLNPGKNYRMPTEAEWEYAARGGHKMSKDIPLITAYAGGSDVGKVAWYRSNSGRKTHPVGTRAPNALGLYDMSGNVLEWCSDWYGDYTNEAQTNPIRPKSGSSRNQRGGSWADIPHFCRVADRLGDIPGTRSKDTGFRLARTN